MVRNYPTGTVVKTEDFPSLVKAIQTLHAHPHLHKNYGENRRLVAEQYFDCRY